MRIFAGPAVSSEEQASLGGSDSPLSAAAGSAVSQHHPRLSLELAQRDRGIAPLRAGERVAELAEESPVQPRDLPG